jgi:hypothetical protein
MMQAPARRALAYDVGRVISFKIADQLRQCLFRHFQDQPLPGYEPTSMRQLQRADIFLFKQINKATRTGNGTHGLGQLPCGMAVLMLMSGPSIVFHLHLLPPRTLRSFKATSQGRGGGKSDRQSSFPPARRHFQYRPNLGKSARLRQTGAVLL